MSSDEVIEKLLEVEHRAKSNTRRIEKLELQTEALTELATSVKLLVAEQQHQTAAMNDIKNDVAELDSKVEALENKPAKRWENIVEKIIMLLVAGVVGYILAQLGLNQ